MAGEYRFKDQSGNIVAQISASVEGAIAFSGSVVDFTQANNVILGNVQLAGTASNALLLDGFDSQAFAFTSSIHPFTASTNSRLGSIETISASNIERLDSLEEKTGSLATTGSNIFYGTQTFSGSLYVQDNLIVQGSSSLQNITASAVSIGTNIVYLNTDTPAVRFAGLTVQDSGSSAGVTGSMLWDSLCNRWIYSNPSGVGYSGGMLLSGPRASTLGEETTLTCNYIAKSGGGDHLYDSCIWEMSGSMGINTSSPAVALHVDASGGGIIRATRLGSGVGYIQLEADGTNGTLTSSNGLLINTGGSQRVNITSTGIACFSCQICAPSFIGGILGLSTATADYAATITNVQDSSQGLLIRATDNDTTLCLLSLQGSAGATCQTWVDRFVVTKDGTKYFGNPAGSRFQMNASGENFYQYTNNYYIWGLYNDANSLSIESAFGGCIIFRTSAQTISSSPTTTTERMRIMHNGSVIMQSSLGICNGGAINMTIPNGNNGGSIRMACCTGANQGDMYLTGGGGTGLLIAGAGHVGIGTTTPDTLLTLDTQIANFSTGILSTLYASKGTTEGAYLQIRATRHSTQSVRRVEFLACDGASNSANIVLNPAGGCVGIGTFTPGQTLAVQGNSYFGCLVNTLNFSQGGNDRFLEIGAGSGGDALFVAHSSGYGVAYFGYEASNDRLVIATDCGSGANKIDFILNAGTTTGGTADNLNVNPAMRITAGGPVIIGATTTNKGLLRVAGNAEICKTLFFNCGEGNGGAFINAGAALACATPAYDLRAMFGFNNQNNYGAYLFIHTGYNTVTTKNSTITGIVNNGQNQTISILATTLDSGATAPSAYTSNWCIAFCWPNPANSNTTFISLAG